MFNASTISGKLLGIVGFRQPSNPVYAIIDADNLASTSGLYATDNPMVKVEYIKESQDYVDISDADFNTYLKNKQNDSIVTVANAIFNMPDFIDRQVLYKNASNKVDLETLPNGFVGYKIQVDSGKNLAFEITRTMLDFSGTGDIELMLFNTSSKTPLFTKVITITTDHQEEVLNWVVDNSGDTYKGDYYLGYLSNYVDIGTLQPFKRDYNLGQVESIITHLCIEKGFVAGHTTNTLFDLEDWDGMSETTGINPDITVFEDFTDLIVQNKSFFARAIQLDMQIGFISEMLNSLRANRDKRMGEASASKLMIEIEGQTSDSAIKVTGLRPLLFREVGRVRNEIEKIREGYSGIGFYTETLS
jgi:hypothetical protein